MTYLARFRDPSGVVHTRRFFASHVYNANKKASGIAKSNGWKVVSVGRV